MKFLDVLQQSEWSLVKDVLFRYCDESVMHLFQHLHTSLQEQNEMDLPEIALRIVIDYLDEEDTFDVYGIKEGDEYPYNLAYSLPYEWLGYDVDEKTLATFSMSEITAHCLWVMTYLGTDEEEIHLRRNEILNFTARIDNHVFQEEKELCPYCEGTKTKGDGEICWLCDEEGNITYILL